jgi:hypothetical protein
MQSNFSIEGYRHYFYDQHEIFKLIVDHGIIVPSTEIPTACVTLDNNNRIIFHINLDFWHNTLQSEYDRVFVIAHEICHLFFGHLGRLKDFPQEDYRIFNIAADVYIDHFIEDVLGIGRWLLGDFLKNEISWVETVFKDETVYGPISDHYNQSLEYYFDLLKQNSKEFDSIVYFPIGSISSSGDVTEKGISDLISEKTGEHIDDLVEKLKEENPKYASSQGAGSLTDIKYDVLKQKQPWYSVIDEWCRVRAVPVQKTPRWGFMNRRSNNIMKYSNFIFPGDYKGREHRKERNNIALFLDVSGSCQEYAPTFVGAARMIPSEHFNVRTFVFNVDAYEVTDQIMKKVPRIPLGGGTHFMSILKILNQKNVNPDAIFVITDGYDYQYEFRNSITDPKKYFFFLTDSSTTTHLPGNSNIFKLRDYVVNLQEGPLLENAYYF